MKCLYPDVKAVTAYKKGCRCDKCRFHKSKIRSQEGKKEANKKRKRDQSGYRMLKHIPVTNCETFSIVPEVAPIIRKLADICAMECPPESGQPATRGHAGSGVLAARVALVLKIEEEAALRRLYSVIHQRQLFINSAFVEACLMAMELEHEYEGRYSEWPRNRTVALDRVSFEAECSGKKMSPQRLSAKANRLYEKGFRRALKHAPEVRSTHEEF